MFIFASELQSRAVIVGVVVDGIQIKLHNAKNGMFRSGLTVDSNLEICRVGSCAKGMPIDHPKNQWFWFEISSKMIFPGNTSARIAHTAISIILIKIICEIFPQTKPAQRTVGLFRLQQCRWFTAAAKRCNLQTENDFGKSTECVPLECSRNPENHWSDQSTNRTNRRMCVLCARCACARKSSIFTTS